MIPIISIIVVPLFGNLVVSTVLKMIAKNGVSEIMCSYSITTKCINIDNWAYMYILKIIVKVCMFALITNASSAFVKSACVLDIIQCISIATIASMESLWLGGS